MKRSYLLLSFVCASVVSNAQSDSQDLPSALNKVEVDGTFEVIKGNKPLMIDGVETVIWSEDFSGGIPSTWTNEGFNAGGTPSDALWEYRGPSTNPNSGVGSRGGFACPVPPCQGDPLISPTASNGFVIFDSNYLDDNGLRNAGSGPAPAPHMGILTTDYIDLTNELDVVIELFSYSRFLSTYAYLTFNVGSGDDFGDTISLYDEFDVNASTPRDHRVLYNVSDAIGGQDSVRVRIIFDGTRNHPDVVPGLYGYYFWMLDDIAIKQAPPNLVRYIDIEVPVTGGVAYAPAYDLIFDNPEMVWGASGRYGITTLREARGIAFDANVLNYGSDVQTNLMLEVEILQNGTSLTTVSSPAVPILEPGDTADFTQLITPYWTPTQKGTYDFVFNIVSDSISLADARASSISPPDTIRYVVSDSVWASDFSRAFNGIGTAELGSDGSIMALSMEVKENERDQIRGVRMNINRSGTRVGGEVEFRIYPLQQLGGQEIAYAQAIITETDSINGYVRADFYNPASNSGHADVAWTADQPDSAVWIAVTMYSNGGANPISVLNDQTLKNTPQSRMFVSDQGSWFTGYANNSRRFALPHLRLFSCGSQDACALSVEEIDEQTNNLNIKYYPNPNTGTLFLDFEDMKGEKMSIRITDLTGKTVLSQEITPRNVSQHQLHLDHLRSGMYIMSIETQGKSASYRIAVQK